MLQAVTVPHADLAARVSKLSVAEVQEAQQTEESQDVVTSRDMDGDEEGVEGEDDSEDEAEVEMAPDPSGDGALHSSAGKNPVKRSVKKAFRFASPSKIEEQLVDEVPEDEPNKKFKKPKGSVFIKKSEAFDFHGEDLNEEDAASFASFAGLDQDEGGHPGNATTASSGSPQQQYVYQSC